MSNGILTNNTLTNSIFSNGIFINSIFPNSIPICAFIYYRIKPVYISLDKYYSFPFISTAVVTAAAIVRA